MITVTDISKSYGDRNLFSNLSVNIISGQRIGLVGSNGTGKSTLLDIIFGEKSPDSGNIVKQRNLSVGYLTQNAISPSHQTLINMNLLRLFLIKFHSSIMLMEEPIIGYIMISW